MHSGQESSSSRIERCDSKQYLFSLSIHNTPVFHLIIHAIQKIQTLRGLLKPMAGLKMPKALPWAFFDLKKERELIAHDQADNSGAWPIIAAISHSSMNKNPTHLDPLFTFTPISPSFTPFKLQIEIESASISLPVLMPGTLPLTSSVDPKLIPCGAPFESMSVPLNEQNTDHSKSKVSVNGHVLEMR